MDEDLWGFINQYLLNLIIAFDKTNNYDFLEMAAYINDYLEEKTINIENKNVCFLNGCQIKKRKNIAFSDFEKDKLNKIASYHKNNMFLFAINVLLENKKEALGYYNILTKEEEDLIKILPIFYLYQLM
jgi:hypothetical protein